jgi:hypothetical protein
MALGLLPGNCCVAHKTVNRPRVLGGDAIAKPRASFRDEADAFAFYRQAKPA